MQSCWIIHTWASARRRVQSWRKPAVPARRDVSALAHEVHKGCRLPERRSQMFPHRSQYLSCKLPNCTGSPLVFILPLGKKMPAAWQTREDCRIEGLQTRLVRLTTTGLGSFAMT
jgi:hypothetical protein